YKEGQKVKKSEEFVFRIHSAARQKVDNTANIDRITSTGLGRIPDVGLKSVSFKESGGYEQAHVPATIIAKIELYCNTLDSILINYKERGPDGSVQFPFGKTEQEPPPPPILDLISYSDKFANDSNKEDFDCFETIFDTLRNVNKIEIHAHVGWSVPNNARNLRDLQEFKDFKTAIESTRAVLILNLLKSEIDFQEDGSIRILGEYQARVESIMNDPALGVLNFNLKSDEALRDLIKDKREGSNTSSFLDKPDNIFLAKSNSLLKKMADFPLTTVEKLCNQLKIDSTSTQALKNKEIIKSIMIGVRAISSAVFSNVDNRIRVIEQNKIIDSLINQNKIFHWEINELTFNALQMGQDKVLARLRDLHPNATPDQLRKLGWTLYPEMFNLTTFNSNNISISGALAEANKKELTKKLSTIAGEADKEDRKSQQIEALKDFLEKQEEAASPGYTRISWFYLGDLFDIILDEFYENSGLDDIKFILGPVQSPSQGRAGDISNEIFNLSNLPISLDLFVKWWTQNVVIPGRTTYSLKNFIKDILSQIIAPATGQNCANNDSTRVTLQGNYIIFHAPKDFRFENGVIHSKEKMDELVKAIQASVERPKPEDLITYVYIYALDPKYSNRTGNKEEDENDGIYHLSYGNDRGIVRRIQFRRIETRGRREALLEQFEGINNLAHHSERYNANIYMEGNGIFKPGMQVFINPYTSTISKKVSPVKLVNALGLGGYYWISEIETTFEGTNYETIIECIWTSPGTYSPTGIDTEAETKPNPSDNPYGINK
ncbi:MAG: hypothetical protein MI810_02845, partial [Flavobacteriales bacterium]|nr:hypothetical protein [Flavobacteriales bacterium]